MTSAAASRSPSLTVDTFLKQQRREPTSHIVIGNEAGDADSVISAIAWAYVESLYGTDAANSLMTPIISIRRKDLETQRPETLMLLGVSGISTDCLIYVDDPIITHHDKTLQVTLVDHNRLTLPLVNYKVLEILDHHADLGAHIDATSRLIAFRDGFATVASTCTVIVEKMNKICKARAFPASLSVLLLGVILLDSVNMFPAAAKGTERDQAAIDLLLRRADWSDLSEVARTVLRLDDNDGHPDTNALFQALQDAKFSSIFWDSLSVYDALRLDYKKFESLQGSAGFGSSSVLISLDDFLNKQNVHASILSFMEERGINWLFVLFNSIMDGNPKRQLMACTTSSDMDAMIDYLMKQETLQLARRDDPLPTTLSPKVQTFDQGNTKASRKQVAPILHSYFNVQHQAAAL